jgi:hypothetical protein
MPYYMSAIKFPILASLVYLLTQLLVNNRTASASEIVSTHFVSNDNDNKKV